MRLIKLSIEVEQWSENKGKYKGEDAGAPSGLNVELVADKATVQYAEYILNHYDKNSHADHLVLARQLEDWANKRNQVAGES